MRWVAALVVACVALVACGGGGDGEDDPLIVYSPQAFEDVARDMVEAFNIESRGWTAELVVGDDEVAATADAVMTVGEGSMVDLADAGIVRADSWNRIAEKGSTEIWVAIAANANDPDGGLQWVSFASGASPWAVFEAHGFKGALQSP